VGIFVRPAGIAFHHDHKCLTIQLGRGVSEFHDIQRDFPPAFSFARSGAIDYGLMFKRGAVKVFPRKKED
jgi:hypothetical protein